MNKTREFNGKLFNIYDTVIYKNEAIRKKEKLKRQGFNVRIIKTKVTRNNPNNFIYQIWIGGHIKW